MLSDVTLSNLRVQLEPGAGALPFTPAVTQFDAGLSAAAFAKIVQAGIAMVQSRLPVDVQYVGSQLTATGAEVTARVKRSVLKADIRAKIELSTPNPSQIRIRISEITGPAWVPANMVIEQVMAKAAAQPGVTRAANDLKAVDVDPMVVLKGFNLPVTIAQPGAWSVNSSSEEISVGFSASDT